MDPCQNLQKQMEILKKLIHIGEIMLITMA